MEIESPEHPEVFTTHFSLIYLNFKILSEKHVIKKPAQKKENLPWVEKYRPSNLKDLISHDSIINTCNENNKKKKREEEKGLKDEKKGYKITEKKEKNNEEP